MNEKYKIIRKKFQQIINEKNNLKEKRSKSFIEINNSYIPHETENNNNNNDISNITKNSFYIKEDNTMNAILNKKFNILKKSLDKLQLIIENNINNDNKETNKIIDNIYQIKNHYKNELINDSISMSNDLQLIKKEFSNEIKKRETSELDAWTDVNNLKNEMASNINESRDRINFYLNNQQNYLNNINKKITDQVEQINNSFNNDMQYSNQKYNIIMNDITSINNKINIFDSKEGINRQNFKDSITCILNSEIDKIKNDELNSSFDVLRSKGK